MTVAPREGPEGSVFRFRGTGWRPGRLVRITYGAYCRPDEACILILYIGRIRTGRGGGFTFRLRAGPQEPGDAERRIHSGGRPTFSQRVRRPGGARTVQRSPRYRVILPD
jgi:hypothetical protein